MVASHKFVEPRWLENVGAEGQQHDGKTIWRHFFLARPQCTGASLGGANALGRSHVTIKEVITLGRLGGRVPGILENYERT